MAEKSSQELTRNQRRAVDALLQCTTIKDSALFCGLTETTMYRYLRQDHFKAELAKRQAAILTGTSAALSRLSQIATDALGQAMGVLAQQAGADVGDFIKIDDKGVWSLDLSSASDDDLLHLVKRLQTDKDGVDKLELHDAQGAAVALGRLAVSVIEQRRKVVELEELEGRVAALETASVE